MPKKYDVIIIGAGIIGCSIAFECAKKGLRTLNVDRLPAAGYGSTSNSCAIIRLYYSTREGVALAYENYPYWVQWEDYLGVKDDSGLARYIEKGSIVFKTPRNKNLSMVMKYLDDFGIRYEELGPEDIRKKLPIIDTRLYGPPKRPEAPNFGKPTGEAVEGAVLVPQSGYMTDPQLSTHNVQRAAEQRGAAFQFNAEVVQILKQGNRLTGIRLKDGTRFDTPVVVNVAGPHSCLVNRMAGVEESMKIRTRAIKVEVCHVPTPEGFDYDKDGIMLSDGDIGNYSRPEVGNHILIGSEEPDCDELDYVDPECYNMNFTDQWTAQAMRQAQRIKGLPIPNQPKGVVDLYDKTDDWIPIYDKSDLQGFYMAIGTSGNQYKNAPVVGEMMAELIEQCEGGHDHDSKPLQFQLKHTGRVLDVGCYSRLREINRDSSFSVIG